jgi:DNA-binding IclR family transcriptional regulator
MVDECYPDPELRINRKNIAAAIAGQGGKAFVWDIITLTKLTPSYAKRLCLGMSITGYVTETNIGYELTPKGWALIRPERDLEQVKENRLAALERLSTRERRSLMQTAVS